MVRKVIFQNIFRLVGAGSDPASEKMFAAAIPYTSDNHSAGGGLSIAAPNIEITVPDNWGANTLSMIQNEGDSGTSNISSLVPLGDAITMNIVIKAHGNINTYYRLRDMFVRTWGTGVFTVNIQTGDYYGGNQFIDGYFSSIEFDEFRSSNDVSGTGVFTPITPWYFQYGKFNETLRFGDCPVFSGKPKIDSEGYAMINTNFISAITINLKKSDNPSGIKIISADYADPIKVHYTHILPEDIFPGDSGSCSILDSQLYARDEHGLLTTSLELPTGILAFGLNPNATVKLFHYSEKYTMADMFPDLFSTK